MPSEVRVQQTLLAPGTEIPSLLLVFPIQKTLEVYNCTLLQPLTRSSDEVPTSLLPPFCDKAVGRQRPCPWHRDGSNKVSLTTTLGKLAASWLHPVKQSVSALMTRVPALLFSCHIQNYLLMLISCGSGA